MNCVLVSGSSGLIGRHLVKRLEDDGVRVIRLKRSGTPDPNTAIWNQSDGKITGPIEEVDTLFHLAGAGVADKRWSESYKREILKSRIEGTHQVITGIAQSAKLQRLVVGSAIGFYGSNRPELCDEESPQGDGFLAKVVAEWENSALSAVAAHGNIVLARTGIVLAKDGGVLKKQLPIFKAGLGGRIGDGSSYLSWIHIEDEVNALIHLARSDLFGVVNLVAPNPVTNADFTTYLARVLRKPSFMTVPRIALEAILGREMANETALSSTNVSAQKLLSSGFAFTYPTLEPALEQIITS
ncbi:MAG: TIGR01777 family oxidoreductase [Actinomycetota bacterium]|nr:TIGR01777 family oxidoreductase [Actinomycetota bacterium]